MRTENLRRIVQSDSCKAPGDNRSRSLASYQNHDGIKKGAARR